MARAGRRRDDEISVAELLRATGATPRSLAGAPQAAPPREEDTGDGYRERLEQRARDAAAAQQRVGRRIRWISGICGGLVVVGSLVVIAVTSDSSPLPQAAPAPLAPATSSRPTSSHVKPVSPTPIPTVLRQTSTAPIPVETAKCLVRFSVTDQWTDGFTAGVSVTNNGSETLSPWTLTWTFAAGQRVTHSWNGDFSQRGQRVTIDAVSYNATLAPGATVDIGFNATGTRRLPASRSTAPPATPVSPAPRA